MKKFRCLCFFMLILCSVVPQLEAAASAQSNAQRTKDFDSYDTPLTQKDQKNIAFIINTLSEKSLFQLMFQKKALEEAGDRIIRVHPLRFLAYVYSSKNLKGKTKNIKGEPWRRFVNDMGVSLADAAKVGELKKEYIANFAKTVGIKASDIEPMIKAQKWREFINYLKNNA